MQSDHRPTASGNNVLASIEDGGVGESNSTAGTFSFPKDAGLSADEPPKLVIKFGNATLKPKADIIRTLYHDSHYDVKHDQDRTVAGIFLEVR